ncbi:MAG: hypothetical protein DME94_08810, partial [Verrucomicrobia bacterium]
YQITKPAEARLLSREPNSGEEWYKRDPAEPGQIKRRKTTCVEKPAADRRQPRPQPRHFE